MLVILSSIIFYDKIDNFISWCRHKKYDEIIETTDLLFFNSKLIVSSLTYDIAIARSPQVGFEPTTNRLTADRSTTELLRKNNLESSTL